MAVKVWIVGEGNNELGRDDGHDKRRGGVLEALLARVCDGGWECTGKLPWHAIQKFRAGGARLAGPNHGDYLNVLGLVLTAYEDAAEAVAFSRDVDSDPDREDAVATALAWIRDESGWLIEVIGGVAKPAIEGWILALRAVPGADAMSRARAEEPPCRAGDRRQVHRPLRRCRRAGRTRRIAALRLTIGRGVASHLACHRPRGPESPRAWPDGIVTMGFCTTQGSM